MPSLSPFRALRYDPATIRLDDVIAPYDVIGPSERSRLAARHPASSVLVEVPEADLATGRDRYQVAADLLGQWRASGLVRRDPTPSLYPYAMTTPAGARTIGVLGALALPGPGQAQDVLPHEETLPKPKSDRLDLLRATGANLSPIWGLSLATGLSALLLPDGPPAASAFDDDGVRHELWVLDDPGRVAAVAEAVAAEPVVIADGHHRYETALAYRKELGLGARGAPEGAGAVLALVVELSEDQLTVGAIHRTVRTLAPGADLVGSFATVFDVARAGPADGRTVAALGESKALALVTATDAWLLVPRPEVVAAEGSDLDSALVARALAGAGPVETEHRHSWAEAIEPLRAGEVQAAVLLRPATVAQIRRYATERRRMPPKTTYFSPKPRTGMVFRTLVDD